MIISGQSRELVRAKGMAIVSEVLRGHRDELRRLREEARRSGFARGQLDHKFVEMITEIVDRKANEYVAAFRLEHKVLGLDDIREIREDLSAIARDIWYGQGHSPLPSSADSFSEIVPRAEMALMIAMREMEIEQRHAMPAPAAPVAMPHAADTAPLTVAADPDKLSLDDLDALELKPNIFGLGINVNHIIHRIRQWSKNRKNRTSE